MQHRHAQTGLIAKALGKAPLGRREAGRSLIWPMAQGRMTGNRVVVGIGVDESFLGHAGKVRRKMAIVVPIHLSRTIAVDDPDEMPCFRTALPGRGDRRQ